MEMEIEQELISHVIEKLNDIDFTDEYKGDLHSRLFNEDFYIIGYYECEQWIKKHDLSMFDMIETIQTYEKEQFGETYTDISSSEKLVNMYVYILGEELLYDLDSYNDYQEDKLNEEVIEQMLSELNDMIIVKEEPIYDKRDEIQKKLNELVFKRFTKKDLLKRMRTILDNKHLTLSPEEKDDDFSDWSFISGTEVDGNYIDVTMFYAKTRAKELLITEFFVGVS